MTTPRKGEHAQTESLRPIQRFNNIAGLMNPESRGLYVRYEDHAAQVAALTAAPVAPLFDEQGFREWVLRNLPDDTIIGNSAWWADHLTAWAKRFVTAPPAQPAPQGVAYAEPDFKMGRGYIERSIGGVAYREGWVDALEALRASNGQAPAGATDDRDQKCFCFGSMCEHCAPKRPTAQAAPAATDPAYSEACSLATALFEKHYRQEPDYASGRVVWSLCDTTAGVISQIDNMVSGLARAPAAGAVSGPVDDIDAIALARYKVVPSHDSMFHRFAVVAGDGKQQLYLGRETECQNMARKFAGAFLDGAFYQSHAAAPTQAAQADSVLEDAARDFPELTPELASILGTICFQCIHFAQALRAAGHQIKTRAEDEQAAVLHWMLGHYFRHGDEGWRKAAADEMKRMQDAARKQGGA